jgi:hypothetical protein
MVHVSAKAILSMCTASAPLGSTPIHGGSSNYVADASTFRNSVVLLFEDDAVSLKRVLEMAKAYGNTGWTAALRSNMMLFLDALPRNHSAREPIRATLKARQSRPREEGEGVTAPCE